MHLRKLVAGNWKMHGLRSDLAEVKAIADQSRAYPQVDVALCVPATLIEPASQAVPDFAIGGEDSHPQEQGAYTGCISPLMLRDAGASLTIVGHSERRQGQHESDEEVKAKAETALSVGLDVIICVGESLAVRECGEAIETVVRQLDASLPHAVPDDAELIVAYEPIWAIGTGRVPTSAEIAEVHSAIRDRLVDRYSNGRNVRILYGGSVKPANAKRIFSLDQVNGALVGGASLKASEFIPIVAAAAAVEVRAAHGEHAPRPHVRAAALSSH